MRRTEPPLPVRLHMLVLNEAQRLYFRTKQMHTPTNPIWALHLSEVYASEIASGVGKTLVCLLTSNF